jgi:hypothetical protein
VPRSSEAETVEIDLVVGTDGRVEAVHSDEAQRFLEELGAVDIRRASDVEYDGVPGGWTINFHAWTGLSSPPGIHETRAGALAEEVDILRRGRLGIQPSERP